MCMCIRRHIQAATRSRTAGQAPAPGGCHHQLGETRALRASAAPLRRTPTPNGMPWGRRRVGDALSPGTAAAAATQWQARRSPTSLPVLSAAGPRGPVQERAAGGPDQPQDFHAAGGGGQGFRGQDGAVCGEGAARPAEEAGGGCWRGAAAACGGGLRSLVTWTRRSAARGMRTRRCCCGCTPAATVCPQLLVQDKTLALLRPPPPRRHARCPR